MSKATRGRSERQVGADVRGKTGRMREARQGNARGKERRMREARQFKCARQGRSDARGKAE
jgi:hypothetical protein